MIDYHNELIKCPECKTIQWAKVEYTLPWFTRIHTCKSCNYLIMESEWDKQIHSGACFSECHNYRYYLWRIWDETISKVMFIGLNPSTASETNDDPTIKRVIHFAKGWGFGGIYMLNLFPFISTDPKYLQMTKTDINEKYLKEISAKCERIVFAWGTFKEAKTMSNNIIKMFPEAYALKINNDGSPRHPLYVKGNIELIRYIL